MLGVEYVCNCRDDSVWGGREWENFSAVVEVVEVVEWRVTLVRTASMPSPDAAARHTGAGVARRQAHHERMRDERAREAAAGEAELPPEDDSGRDGERRPRAGQRGGGGLPEVLCTG